MSMYLVDGVGGVCGGKVGVAVGLGVCELRGKKGRCESKERLGGIRMIVVESANRWYVKGRNICVPNQLLKRQGSDE